MQVDSTNDEPHNECNTEDLNPTEVMDSSVSKIIETLKAKIATLEKANQQIYDFAASLIINGS